MRGDDVRRRSNQIKKHIIDPALKPLGFNTTRADLTDESGLITTQIVNQLLNADLIVADLTGHNPNVFYELALRHAFSKPFIQIISKTERLPFDVAGQWTIFFDYRDLDSAEEARDRITRAAKQILDGGDDYKAESPVSQAVDLQQLRTSGNPEQIAMAEVSEGLAEIRSELRVIRSRQDGSGGFTGRQTEVIRKVLLKMALYGQFTGEEFDELMTAPSTKNWETFLSALQGEMAKPIPVQYSDDEPPF
ncbi:hypothetical protein [Mycolicibacterium pulveris]|uniref:hypothetical protein n=1 Tax=Mycolicibacterium pulveris TaxID=36813 RepID=UPI003CFAD671